MIKKEKFVEYANALRKHYSWLNKLCDMGINIESEAMSCITDGIYDVMLEGDTDYDYDEYSGTSWVAYWCCSNEGEKCFRRMREHIYLPDAGALYDFVEEMHSLGWSKEIKEGWRV